MRRAMIGIHGIAEVLPTVAEPLGQIYQLSKGVFCLNKICEMYKIDCFMSKG